jgi:hypothetical protein
MRFEGLIAVTMMAIAFLVVMLCSLVEIYKDFGAKCCSCLQSGRMKTQAAYFSEMSVNFYHATWRQLV